MEENKRFIPVCEPYLKGNELKYVMDAISTGWISSNGGYVKKFEQEFAKYCGVRNGISVCNGTTALHLALTALGIGEGDEVIIPDFTMISSAFSVCYTKAKPIFVDAEKETWNIDPKKIEEKITENTKAIMVVHIYGHPCEMDNILEIAKRHNLYVIEDSAEAHGAEYKNRKCGSLGDIACFSFYSNKVITTGEGGMIVTDNDEIAEKCRYYRNLCFPLGGSRNYLHEDIGFNYRISNVIAAIGLAQLEKIDEYIGMRRKNNHLYQLLLKEIDGLIFQPERKDTKNIYWMNGIVVIPEKLNITRNELMERLKSEGIDSRPFFTGMHLQPSLEKYGEQLENYEVSDWLGKNGLYLPSGSGLSIEEIKYICDKIKKILGEVKNSGLQNA